METGPAEDEGAVLAALRGGDEAALSDVYARWSPLVYSLALRSLADVGRAEEVTQRVFTQVWAERATVEPVPTRFAAWLVGLSRGAIADARGTATPAPPVSPPGAGKSGEDESKTGVLAERLLLVDEMSHLDATSRQVLQMAVDDHLSHVEIAERTGLDVEEVKHQIARCLIELRQRMEVRADAH